MLKTIFLALFLAVALGGSFVVAANTIEAKNGD